MFSGVVYLLRIFKMFHGLMNNPVLGQIPIAVNKVSTLLMMDSKSVRNN